MKKRDYKKIADNVIELEIQALKKLKNSINNSFNEAVKAIVKCQSKIIFCGVGKSSKISAKLSSTFSSVGSPSFTLSAGDASHGDLGSISKKDILILISYSGETQELKNIIQYANRNKITLIGMASKKNSILYKASDIKLYIPEVKEAGHGIVPTSSTTICLAMGDALAIAAMEYKKFGKLDFKKFHPSGNLGAKLKTVEDLMVTGSKIPFINENKKMKTALKIMSSKKLGILVVRNKKNLTIGIVTDGDLKRAIQKNKDIQNLTVKNIMTKNPMSINGNELAAKALNLMNSKKKITSLCVYHKRNKLKTIGIIHIHNILENNIG
ncbi:KpsF/GutQ family sugar-phosphate isomerase [Candidatus Pelagibacter sp.]|jgi:arabinose-5-phosphate isomerase|nr:KpsF/GutQ family sugar-phosphate isomerase [Candidatus Pelagibacter sp.]|tara:strand:+ start:634 stop:1608 length:975 start_codon:yes stop_codon:yes gene_type:complete